MALAMMRLLQDVTGMDILGNGVGEGEEVAAVEEDVEPWTRWRRLDSEVLDAGGVVIMDGGVGTEIERRAGEESMNTLGWSCSANITYPEVVFDVHMSFLEAGSHIITANTYCTNKNVMEGAGLGSISEKSTRSAVKIAQNARDSYLKRGVPRQGPVLVAGSISCHPPKQAEGSSFNPGEWPSSPVEVSNLTDHAKLLAECKVDLIIVEMVWDLAHGTRAVAAACDTSLPVILSVSLPVPEDPSDPVMVAVKGQLALNTPIKLGGLGDATLSSAIEELTRNRPNIVAVCVHHTPLSLMPHAISAVRSVWPGYLGAYPEHGTFEMPHWNYMHLDVDEFVSHTEAWCQGSDVKLLGGCCGIGPAYIQAISENFNNTTQAKASRRASGSGVASPLPVAPVRPVDLEVTRSSLPPPPVLLRDGSAESNGSKTELPPPPVLERAESTGSVGLPPPPVVREESTGSAGLPPPPVLREESAGSLPPLPVLREESTGASPQPVLEREPSAGSAGLPPLPVLGEESTEAVDVVPVVPDVVEDAPAVPKVEESILKRDVPAPPVLDTLKSHKTEDAITELLQTTASPSRVVSSSGALAAFAASQPAFNHDSPFNARAVHQQHQLHFDAVGGASLPPPELSEDDDAALAGLPPA